MMTQGRVGCGHARTANWNDRGGGVRQPHAAVNDEPPPDAARAAPPQFCGCWIGPDEGATGRTLLGGAANFW
jgi:hypothetical protein